MAKNNDTGIPMAQNCVIAVSLDMKKKTEKTIIGELDDVRRCINGFPHGELYYSAARDLGQLVMDFEPIAGEIADIRAALMDSVGGQESPYIAATADSLLSLYISDNPVHRFTALLMWQEYHRAKHDEKAAENLFDTFDNITLALRFNMIDYVTEWQGYDRSNPLRFSDFDFRKFPVTLYFADDRQTSEYALTDKSPLALCFYYLKRVYGCGRYTQTCPICGRAFVAKTAGMRTLCSDACRRVQGRENKRRHDERAKDVSYERAGKTAYMYWYTKIVKLRGMGLPKREIERVERLFKKYSDEARARKKAVAQRKADAAEFESWLLSQRDIIDELMDEATEK
jgi:hypothetical protein